MKMSLYSTKEHQYITLKDFFHITKLQLEGGNGDCYNKSGTSNLQEFTNYPRTHLEFAYDKEKLHPTQKPVALFEYLIRTYTNEGDLVLDTCIGSGTAAVACINTKRNFIGFELDKGYYNIANTRIASLCPSVELASE